jgi:hypothetical protein
MTDEPNGRPTDRSRVRQNRLRDALRENLKRRKSQSRGRVGQAAADQPEATGSDSAETDSVRPADPARDEIT